MPFRNLGANAYTPETLTALYAARRLAFRRLGFPAYPAHPIAKRAVPVVETWYRLLDKAGR